jgi:hypothetical protein
VGRDGERKIRKLASQFKGRFLLLCGTGGALGLELLEAALGGLRDNGGKAAGEQEVAGVSRSNLDDFTGLAELLHIIHEHNFDLHRDVSFQIKP